MNPNTIALLQVIAAFVAIPITVYGAIVGAERGARKAYQLSEKSALGREARVQDEQRRQQEEQVQALRLLLGLEIRQNLIDLEWLLDNLSDLLGEEKESYYKQVEAEESSEQYDWLEARQRFIAAYLPDWSHRFWYSQQSSYVLLMALTQLEIRQINFHHSQLDRLSRIKNMLTERAQRSSGRFDGTTSGGSTVSSYFREDAPRLWEEFVAVTQDILNISNPLGGMLSEISAGQLTATMTNKQTSSVVP